MDQLQAAGSTFLSAGMRLGLQEVEKTLRLDTLNKVLLLTDGGEMIAQGRAREGIQVLRRATQRLEEMGETELAADAAAVIEKAQQGQLKNDKRRLPNAGGLAAGG